VSLAQDDEVRLRPLGHEDVNRTQIWMQDPDIFVPFLRREPVTPEGHRAWFEAARVDPAQRLFAIDFRSVHVGNAGLKDIDTESRSCELWLYVGEKSLHGRGIGSAATKLLLEHAFETMMLDRVWLRVSAKNQAARKAYAKAGFAPEGNLPDHVGNDGRRVRLVRMAIAHPKVGRR
jgi:RimJ/RimL family protein N-acetyltransferase